jgi:hypothetical protein
VQCEELRQQHHFITLRKDIKKATEVERRMTDGREKGRRNEEVKEKDVKARNKI